MERFEQEMHIRFDWLVLTPLTQPDFRK